MGPSVLSFKNNSRTSPHKCQTRVVFDETKMKGGKSSGFLLLFTEIFTIYSGSKFYIQYLQSSSLEPVLRIIG